MNSSPAIEILSADKTYSNGTRALEPVDLKIQPGEFVTLLGPSGCGKSTLLKMIAGLLAPTDGRILIWNKPVDRVESSGHKLAFVFQEATLMPWSRVRANVQLPLDLHGDAKDESEQRVNDALELVGLSKFANAYPRELSGGMQMRVSIARALVTQPDLLLMDEPFGALDEITRNKLDSDLLDLWEKKKLTVVFVTHSIYEAVYLSTRVVVMAARPGRVIDQVKIDEPYPRGHDFRVSSQFAQYAKTLQDSLLRAAAMGAPAHSASDVSTSEAAQ
jgi:NitT/TauT family transport system ATP-binding protein